MSIQFQFETSSIIMTADNYHIKLKGVLSYESLPSFNDEKQLQDQLELVTSDYFRNISLIEALEFINATKNENLRLKLLTNFEKLGVTLEKFNITTLDAVEITQLEKIDYSIDPDLETKKKKGIFSRFRKK